MIEKYTNKQIDSLVECGAAKHIGKRDYIGEPVDTIGIAKGKRGVTRLLLIGVNTRKLYAITDEDMLMRY